MWHFWHHVDHPWHTRRRSSELGDVLADLGLGNGTYRRPRRTWDLRRPPMP